MASLVFASIEDLMPENPDALHLLGVIAHQVGKNELAVKLITKAVAVNSLVDALLGQRDAGLLDAVGPRGEPLDAPVGAEQVGLALDLGVEARLVVDEHAAIVALDVALNVVAVVREAHFSPFLSGLRGAYRVGRAPYRQRGRTGEDLVAAKECATWRL
jgi:hypothetical protein